MSNSLVFNDQLSPLLIRLHQMFFFTSLSTHFPPVRPFLPLISAPTGFHNWGLVTRWAQLLITSNYLLPSSRKDQSTIRAELTELLRIETVGVIFGTHRARSNQENTQTGLVIMEQKQKDRKVCRQDKPSLYKTSELTCQEKIDQDPRHFLGSTLSHLAWPCSKIHSTSVAPLCL